MESYYFQYMDSYHIIFHLIPFRQFPQLFFNSDIYTLKACANICDEISDFCMVNDNRNKFLFSNCSLYIIYIKFINSP